MVDVNDPSRLGQRLTREWKLLEEADIDDRDRQAITTFVERRRGVENLARSTCISDLGTLRRSSDRARVPLVDMRQPEADAFLVRLALSKEEGGYGIDSDSASMYQYVRSLKKFFEYLDAHPDHRDFEWHEDLEYPDLEVKGSKNREEMLTGEEIEALKDAAKRPRDKALIGLLGDIGGRITLILSLRVGDVSPDGDEPYITPNVDVVDGLKDIDINRIPILHSRGELRAYLRNYHVDGETDAAPLWPVDKGYDPEAPREGAVGDARVRTILKECAKKAGVDKPVEPHNFRRTAATRLSNSDRLTPQEIRQITGWSEDSFNEMLAVYDYTDDAERNSAIHQALGFSNEGTAPEADDLAIDTVVCGTCRETHTHHHCPNCGAPRDEEARQRSRELDGEFFDSMDEAADEQRADVREFRDVTEASPAVRRVMLDRED